jgi:Protein of unknown function (DUF3014)
MLDVGGGMYGERNYIGWVIGIALLIGIGAIGYNAWRQMRPLEVPPPVAESQPPAPAPAAEPKIEHPLPASDAASLPPLEKSDPLLAESLAQLAGERNLAELIFTDNLARRIVATIDNLPREKVATRIALAKPVPGTLAVERKGDEIVLGPRNYARYAPYVQLAQSVDVKRTVAQYVRVYPLLQRAYVDLGYPNGYFNDRLIQVIDHLIATPDVRGPIKLVQPKVRYQFADPDLESLSAGQKAMLRIGPDNAAKLKAVLREARREIAAQTPKQ